MGAVGTSADNSLAEAFNATLKREVLQDLTCWPDEATCRRQLFRCWSATTPATAVLVPLPVSDHLREHHRRYAPGSGITTPWVQEPGVRPLVTAAGVQLSMLADADRLPAVETGRVVDQHPLALGEHGVVGGVPRHP
jgi:hypothetical protein